MSVLSEARQLYADIIEREGDDLTRERMIIKNLIDYAEMRETQAIEERAKCIALITKYDLDIDDAWHDMPEDCYPAERWIALGKKQFREEAAKELDADLSSWHRITDTERAVIQNLIDDLAEDNWKKWENEIGFLRGLL